MKQTLTVILIRAIIILCTSKVILPESKQELKNKIKLLHNQKKFSQSIVFLQRYLKEQKYDLEYHFLYAKALLFRKDLSVASKNKNIHLYQNKKKEIIDNYRLSAKIFRENLTKLEKLTTDKKKLGEYFFLLSMAQWLSKDKIKAINSFKKALKYDKTLNEANYNIASIYESLNQEDKSKLYFKKYLKNK